MLREVCFHTVASLTEFIVHREVQCAPASVLNPAPTSVEGEDAYFASDCFCAIIRVTEVLEIAVRKSLLLHLECEARPRPSSYRPRLHRSL